MLRSGQSGSPLDMGLLPSLPKELVAPSSEIANPKRATMSSDVERGLPLGMGAFAQIRDRLSGTGSQGCAPDAR